MIICAEGRGRRAGEPPHRAHGRGGEPGRRLDASTIFRVLMAYAITGGLAVATGLALAFMPALYVALCRIALPRRDIARTAGEAAPAAAALE